MFTTGAHAPVVKSIRVNERGDHMNQTAQDIRTIFANGVKMIEAHERGEMSLTTQRSHVDPDETQADLEAYNRSMGIE